jgi:hypothetical protein
MAQKNKRQIKDYYKAKRPQLTPLEKKRCVAAYLFYGTYERASQECGVSRNTVKNCVKADPDFAEKYQEKRKQEMEEIFGALSVRGKKFIKFCDMFLDHLSSDQMKAYIEEDPFGAAKIFGITLDKFIVINKVQEDGEYTDKNITVNVYRKSKREGEQPVNLNTNPDEEVL